MQPTAVRAIGILALLAALATGRVPAVYAAQVDDNGLIDATSYRSPNLGYEVDWDRTWTVTKHLTYSSADVDVLTLTNAEDGATLSVFGFTLVEATEAALAVVFLVRQQRFGRAEIVEQATEEGYATSTIVFDFDGVAIREYIEARPYGRDDEVVAIGYAAPEDDFEDGIAAVRDAITFDGDPLFVDLDDDGPADGDDEPSDDDVPADDRPAVDEPDSHPIHIHAGTCVRLGEVVFPLADVQPSIPTAEMPVAPGPRIPAEVSVTTVEAELVELLDDPLAINVHLSVDEIDTYIACGDVGGPPDDRGNIFIGLAEVDGSGYTGVAWLHGSGDGTTTVTVFLAHGLAA